MTWAKCRCVTCFQPHDVIVEKVVESGMVPCRTHGCPDEGTPMVIVNVERSR